MHSIINDRKRFEVFLEFILKLVTVSEKIFLTIFSNSKNACKKKQVIEIKSTKFEIHKNILVQK